MGAKSLKSVILEIKIRVHKTCLSGLLGAFISPISQICQDVASDCPIAPGAPSLLQLLPAVPEQSFDASLWCQGIVLCPTLANFTVETKTSCLGVVPQPIPSHGPPIQQTPEPKLA